MIHRFPSKMLHFGAISPSTQTKVKTYQNRVPTSRIHVCSVVNIVSKYGDPIRSAEKVIRKTGEDTNAQVNISLSQSDNSFQRFNPDPHQTYQCSVITLWK